MSRNPLTDTDENQAVTPGVGDSSEKIRIIARDEAKRWAKQAVDNCQHQRDMWEAINDLRTKHGEIMNDQALQRGSAEGFLKAQKEIAEAHAKRLTKMVGTITIAGIVATFLLNLWKARHGG